MLAGQALLWIVAIVYLLRVRVRVDETTVLVPLPEPEPVIEEPVEPEIEVDRPSIFDAKDAPAIDDVLASITGVVPVVEIDAPSVGEVAPDDDARPDGDAS